MAGALVRAHRLMAAKFPHWSQQATAAAEREAAAAYAELDSPARNNSLEFVLGCDWAFLPPGLEAFFDRLRERTTNPEITYNPEKAHFMIRCLLEDDEWAIETFQIVMEGVIEDGQTRDLGGSEKFVSLEEWRETMSIDKTIDEAYKKYTFPPCLSPHKHRSTWDIPEYVAEDLTTEIMLSGHSLDKLRQVTGAHLFVSCNGATIYIGSDTEESIAVVKRKLDIIARYFALPSAYEQACRIVLHGENGQETRVDCRFLADAGIHLSRTFYLDRLLYNVHNGYSTFAESHVVVLPWPLNGRPLIQESVPAIDKKRRGKPFDAFRAGTWGYNAKERTEYAIEGPPTARDIALPFEPAAPAEPAIRAEPTASADTLLSLAPSTKVASWVNSLPEHHSDFRPPATANASQDMGGDRGSGTFNLLCVEGNELDGSPLISEQLGAGERMAAHTSGTKRLDLDDATLNGDLLGLCPDVPVIAEKHSEEIQTSGSIPLSAKEKEIVSKPKGSSSITVWIPPHKRAAVPESIPLSTEEKEITSKPAGASDSSVWIPPHKRVAAPEKCESPIEDDMETLSQSSSLIRPGVSIISKGLNGSFQHPQGEIDTGPNNVDLIDLGSDDERSKRVISKVPDPFSLLWQDAWSNARPSTEPAGSKPEKVQPKIVDDDASLVPSVHYTMRQKAGSRRSHSSQPQNRGPETLHAVSVKLQHMVRSLGMFPGQLSLTADLGRLAVIGGMSRKAMKRIREEPYHGRPLNAIQEHLNKKNPDSNNVVFSQILTEEGEDANYLSSLKDKKGQKIWTPLSRRTVYELTCGIQTAVPGHSQFVIEVDGKTFKPSIKDFNPETNAIFVHCMKRTWDCRLSLTAAQNLEKHYGMYAEEIVRLMRIIPRKNRLPVVEVVNNPDYMVDIKSVRIRNIASYTCDVGKYSPVPAGEGTVRNILEISEVHDLDETKRTESDGRVATQYDKPIGKMRPGQLSCWYEAKMKSEMVSKAFEENKTLEFGDEASWSAKQFQKAGAFEGLIRVAMNMVASIDGIGYYNDNGLIEEGVEAAPSQASSVAPQYQYW